MDNEQDQVSDTDADDNEQAPPPADTGDGNEVEKWKALARKHEAQAKANASAAVRLKEIEDAEKDEATKSAERIAELEKALADANRTILRNKIAADKGLPAVLAARLTGDDEESMSADADELLASLGDKIGKSQPPPPADTGGGVRGETAGADESDPKALAEAVLNRH